MSVKSFDAKDDTDPFCVGYLLFNSVLSDRIKFGIMESLLAKVTDEVKLKH